MHPATRDETTLLAECQTRRQRRSGPGGQHRNKVETAIVITHIPTGVRGEASERRSQEQNRQMAIYRLRINLAITQRFEPLPANDEVPSDLWRRRCTGGRISVNPEHDDFPALLAEALDRLAARQWEPKAAAAELACTPSQLLKLLHAEPRAFELLARRRQELGLRPLR